LLPLPARSRVITTVDGRGASGLKNRERLPRGQQLENVPGVPGLALSSAGPNSAPIALQVDDVVAARTLLEANGVTFQVELLDSGVCQQAIFSDPDGNPLILHHRYASETGT